MRQEGNDFFGALLRIPGQHDEESVDRSSTAKLGGALAKQMSQGQTAKLAAT